MVRVEGKAVPDNARRFAAFISYSHADSAIAAKLQRQLERYRLPKQAALVRTGQETAIGSIFRDREDLAAAPSLSVAIRNALALAEALIVICSPDAKASHWVSEEIALFRELHPDRPVLAALVRGEPAESFPAALTEGGLEPLAADLRKEGDGWPLGFLKIVAGIAGVPVDALVQRDAQRRLRRVMWITAAAVGAMLTMGIMTSLAIQARNEAARQRASAEGLVEYMLTDLRARLKGVGRLDVMDAVNERAMQYYSDAGSLESLPDDSLGRRARLLHAMGEDDDKRGEIQLAAAKFNEAHRATQTVLARNPDDAGAIFAHAQSEYWLGYAAFVHGDVETARARFERYARQAERLRKIDETKPEWVREVGYAQGNICSVDLADKANPDRSIQSCTEALRTMQAVLALQPGNPEAIADVANRHAWRADALAAASDLNGAYRERLNEESQLRKLGDLLTSNSDYQDRWVGSQINLIKLERRIGLAKRAEQRRQDVAKAVAALVARDRQNVRWQKFAEALEKLVEKGAVDGNS